MQLPPQESDITIEELLQDLPEDVLKLAREKKAFQRGRKIKEPEQLLQIALQYCGLDYSLRAIAGSFSLRYEPISDQSILERLESSKEWLKEVLVKLLPGAKEVEKIGLSWRILVVDGTRVQGPGARTADHILHLCINLATGKLEQIQITDRHKAESLNHYSYEAGDLVVGDRGYCNVKAMSAAHNQGAELVVRLNSGAVIIKEEEGEQGKRLDLVAKLVEEKGETVSMPVVLGSKSGEEIKGYLHASRLSIENAKKAEKRIKRKGSRHQTKVKPETLFLAQWLIVFTTVSIDVLNVPTVLGLYRTRWQIELVIKRYKSLLDLDKLRTRAKGKLSEVWLQGKMIYVLLLQRRADREYGSELVNLESERPLSWWRIWSLVKEQVQTIISGARCWLSENVGQALKAMRERKRKRQLQVLPPGVNQMLSWKRNDIKNKQAAAV